MENISLTLKAIADESRLKIVKLLLVMNCCVGKLAKELGLSEAAISQHLKVLREVGLIEGQKHGHFMHYEVKREVLSELAEEILALASLKRIVCSPEKEKCGVANTKHCLSGKNNGQCSEEIKFFCHGPGHDKNARDGEGV